MREMSRKPDFFIVGAAKSGTSSLHNYLVQHPGVSMSEPKEPHFFYNRESPGSPALGKKDLDEYLKLFEDIPEDVRAGEASTSYLYAANAPREIQQFREGAKIIMVLRNPVDRAYSQYWNQVRDGVEPLSFEEALDAEPERIRRSWWHGFYYMDTGRYADQVARYLETFGRGSVRDYLFEDVTRDAQGVCRDIFSFLGVDDGHKIDSGKAFNPSGPPRSGLLSKMLAAEKIKEPVKKLVPGEWVRPFGEWLREKNRKPTPEMKPETRTRLQESFEPDILRLQVMIGRDLGHWLSVDESRQSEIARGEM